MDKEKNLRVIVFDSLIECLKNGRKSHILIKDVLDKYDYLDNTDKNFIKKLFEGTVEKMILDADDLGYISSAGLRIIIKLVKREKNVVVTNVSPEIYDIFRVSGFTNFISVERKEAN